MSPASFKCPPPCLAVLRLCLLLLPAVFVRGEIALQDKVQSLAVPHQGPFVRTADGAIWGMNAAGALRSADEGASWEHRTIFDAKRFQPRDERALLRTKEGVILYAFLNQRELVFRWDQRKGGPQAGCRLPVYVSRSADDGLTWEPPVLRQEGWCGAVRQMIQLRTGRVLLISQQAVANPGRHVTIIHYSDDLGQTWRESAAIDLGEFGGYGDHGGGIEGTAFEMASGIVKMLLRTPQECFVELTSRDGATWSRPVPSTLMASDAPGMVARLASGQVALLWNRYRDPVKKLGRREELSIAFSGNDGVSWTTPQVIAMDPTPPGERARRLSYPYLFEPAPGRLWISTMQGNLRIALNEADFVTPVARPLDGADLRVITLGDSITRGVRVGVKPTEVFGARLQALWRERQLRANVHNLGVGGERTDQALARLERDVISQRPALVTVMYGTNDCWVDKGRSESRLSEDEFGANLRTLVRRLQAAGIAVVLMTAPAYGENGARNGLDEEPNVRLGRYMERVRKVAGEERVPVVDHFAGWQAEQRSGRRLQDWTTDGLHPNPAGHADLAQRLDTVAWPMASRLQR